MGIGIRDSELDDLMAATLYDLGRPKIQLVAQRLQSYEIMGKIFKDKRIIPSGKGIQRTLMLKHQNTATHKGRYAEDNIDVTNLLSQLQVPWKHIDDGWAYDIAEVRQNRGKSLINNIIKPRRASTLLSIFDEVEEKGWTAPASTTTDDPYGIAYWIVTNATQGFNGGAPTGHTTVGGINLTTYPNFKNWTDTYTNVTQTDLFRNLRLAAYKCHFKSPVDDKDFQTASGQTWRLYTTFDLYSKMVEAAQNQNDNLGADLDKMNGQVVFNRHPIIPVPQLDENSTDYVYGINHSTFYVAVLKDSYLVESAPKPAAKRHNVRECYIDLDYNYVCLDRRSNFVISSAS
jgi:hypothetical protein